MTYAKYFFPQFWMLVLLALLLLTCACTEEPERIFPPTPSAGQTWWIPEKGSKYQIQLADYPIDLDIEADIFEIDLFETPPEIIQALHTQGLRVVCYINAGAWEVFRPDAVDFPSEVIGRDYVGWPGEKWLDISHFETFSALMEKRFDLAVEKGCDAIETDNIQGYQQATGFSITYQDQLEYNLWLSRQAHNRGLGIGLKNDPDEVPDLLPYFDFAVIEDCAVYDECELFLPFVHQGKAVIQIEYSDSFNTASEFCAQALANGYNGLLKHRTLDSWVEFCD